MSQPQLIHINSLDKIRLHAAAWDDLWWRSAVIAPSARAELVAKWYEHFAPEAGLHILAVEQDDQLVAVLPLHESRRAKAIAAGALPNNDWSGCGDFLLDPLVDPVAVCDTLVAGLRELPLPAICIEQYAYTEPHWQHLVEAFERSGMFFDLQPQYLISQAKIGNDWDAYMKTRTGGQMKTRLRQGRKMEREGGTELKVYTEFEPGQVEELMDLVFEVEAKSWKGDAGTSILQQPGLAEYYTRDAVQLAEWGQLTIYVLEFAGEPVAAGYAWEAKGCHFCVKIGYDDAHRKYGPGQQMYRQILERLHGDAEFELVDFWGEKMAWNESWATHFYPVGRLIAVPRRNLRGFGLVAAYKYLRPLLRRMRGIEAVEVPPRPAEDNATPAGAKTADSPAADLKTGEAPTETAV